MLKKIKSSTVLLGLVFTIAVAVALIVLAYVGYLSPEIYARVQSYLYDFGIDTMGALVCAALFFGCMKQKGDGTRAFRTLVVLVSCGFAANAAMYFIMGAPSLASFTFAFCLISKCWTS